MTDHPRRRKLGQAALRSPVSVVLSSLAAFLVVLAVLTGRVVKGQDPTLRVGSATSAIVSHGGRTVLRTTASGRTVAEPTGGRAGAPPGAAQAPGVVTRTSGAQPGGGEADE